MARCVNKKVIISLALALELALTTTGCTNKNSDSGKINEHEPSTSVSQSVEDSENEIRYYTEDSVYTTLLFENIISNSRLGEDGFTDKENILSELKKNNASNTILEFANQLLDFGIGDLKETSASVDGDRYYTNDDNSLVVGFATDRIYASYTGDYDMFILYSNYDNLPTFKYFYTDHTDETSYSFDYIPGDLIVAYDENGYTEYHNYHVDTMKDGNDVLTSLLDSIANKDYSALGKFNYPINGFGFENFDEYDRATSGYTTTLYENGSTKWETFTTKQSDGIIKSESYCYDENRIITGLNIVYQKGYNLLKVDNYTYIDGNLDNHQETIYDDNGIIHKYNYYIVDENGNEVLDHEITYDENGNQIQNKSLTLK